jgi:hypothetical protein
MELTGIYSDSRSDNKVRELAAIFLPWQQWTEISAWFVDAGNQCFPAVLLLIYDGLFLSGIYYYLSAFWCAVARMLELELEHCL